MASILKIYLIFFSWTKKQLTRNLVERIRMIVHKNSKNHFNLKPEMATVINIDFERSSLTEGDSKLDRNY